MEYIIYRDSDELYHHGIKGMRWGIRRYQNEDGSLTEAGKRHYDIQEAKLAAKTQVKTAKLEKKKAEAYERAKKAEIKAAKKESKRQVKLEKLEAKKLKMEMKAIKNQIAYQKGLEFGKNFMPQFAASLGRASGQALGDMVSNLDAQKWYKARTTRITSNAAKTSAEAAKKKNELDEEKFYYQVWLNEQIRRSGKGGGS